MKQGVVICTWSGGAEWAARCLNSLAPIYGKYPIYVVINDGPHADEDWMKSLSEYFTVVPLNGDYWEIGAIMAISMFTDVDEFWLFQDTVEILDTGFIDYSFGENLVGETCSYHPNPMQYYIGKWQTSVIRQMENIDIPSSKEGAIYYEGRFYNAYREVVGPERGILIMDTSFNALSDKSYLEMVYGQPRLVAVGHSLVKRYSLGTEENVTGLIYSDPSISDERRKYWLDKISAFTGKEYRV